MTSARSKRLVRRGYAGCVEVAIRRLSAGCGRAGIRSSQPRRWREETLFLLNYQLMNATSQDVLLGRRYVRAETARAQWCTGTALLARRVFGHVGSGRARRRRSRWCARFRGTAFRLGPGFARSHRHALQMMNEPHRGYIDLPSLHGFDYNTDLHLGDVRAYHPTQSQSPWAINTHLTTANGLIQPRLSSLSFSAPVIRRLLIDGRARSRCPLDAPVERSSTLKVVKPGVRTGRRAGGTCGRCMVYGSGIAREMPAWSALKNTS